MGWARDVVLPGSMRDGLTAIVAVLQNCTPYIGRRCSIHTSPNNTDTSNHPSFGPPMPGPYCTQSAWTGIDPRLTGYVMLRMFWILFMREAARTANAYGWLANVPGVVST